MEHRGSTATLLALLLVLATLLRSSCGGAAGGSEGKHGRKIIIHVPYYIKNHHHTHTVYKYVKKDQHGAGGDSGDSAGGASLEQEHKGHGAGEAGDDFGDHHHHHHHHDGDDDAEFVGHHHHHGLHDDGEATHTTPQALGLHGEPRPDDHHQHPHRYHHDDGGDHHQHPQQHHNGNAGHHDGDFHHNQHQQQRLREEGSHFHHHEQGGRQHHDPHEGDGDRGHAHFHSKFVIGMNDGHLHESDSSESSEHPLHRGEFEPLRGHAPFTGPRENEDPRYEQVNHGYGSFSSHSVHENGEDSDQDEKYHNNQPQYDGFNSLSEQRPEESQQHSSPLYARDQTASYNRHHYDKFEDITEPSERRGLKKRNGKRTQERPRRQKYEVREPIPEQTSPKFSYTSHDHPTEHQSKGHRKHNQEWR